MQMLYHAAKLTGFDGAIGSLASFSDANSVSAWATATASWSVGSELFLGNDGKIRPTDLITRAEAATTVLRLLQKSGLVDVRSNV